MCGVIQRFGQLKAMEVKMTSYFRPAWLALAFVATAVPASAQTWVYEPDNRARVYEPRFYEQRYEPQVYGSQVYDSRAQIHTVRVRTVERGSRTRQPRCSVLKLNLRLIQAPMGYR